MTLRMSVVAKGALAAAALGSLFLSSCGSLYQKYEEKMVRADMIASDKAPEWVRGIIPSTPTDIAFVGRGQAYNVLDERKAFDEAFMHCREQLAQYVGTNIYSESCDQDWSEGARYLPVKDAGPGPGEHVGQALRSRAHQIAESIVGELLPISQYWEQWDVQEDPARHFDGGFFANSHQYEMRRYKVWVLASIPRARVQKFVDASIERLKNETEVAKLKAEGKQKDDVNAKLVMVANDQDAELQALRERIHYGRPFRLTATDNCPQADPCVPLARPQWRNSSIQVQSTVTTETKAGMCENMPLGGH